MAAAASAMLRRMVAWSDRAVAAIDGDSCSAKPPSVVWAATTDGTNRKRSKAATDRWLMRPPLPGMLPWLHLEEATMRIASCVALVTFGIAIGYAAAGQQAAPPAQPTERVTGIGGVFFKAKDPAALGAWYRDNLGLVPQASAGNNPVFEWREREDPGRVGNTVW